MKKIILCFAMFLAMFILCDATDNTAGHFDSYKLAITWTEGFCDSHKDKPECKGIDKKISENAMYAMTLHGLWPNVNGRIDYGNCTDTKYDVYDPSATNSILLSYYQPAVNYCFDGDFCLPKHEWDKHGRCQLEWNQSEYFYVQTKMVKVFRNLFIDQLRARKNISKVELYNIIQTKLPNITHNDIDLSCDKNTGMLQEIRIELSKNIQDITDQQWRGMTKETFVKYVANSSSHYDNCGENILLSCSSLDLI